MSWVRTLRDYFELTKPAVVAVMLVTAAVGMLLATVELPPIDQVVLGLTGIALCAGSAAAINHLLDTDIDRQMQRTLDRPLVQQRVTPRGVAAFAALMGAGGFVLLYVWVNPLTAWLTAASLIGYAFVYTLWLKHATAQNIVIGGLAGAMPPLLGWAAITGELGHQPWLLVLIVFVWTPPHFWALALHRREEYQQASIPVLPVVYSNHLTQLHILLYTVLLLISSVLPWLVGMFGWIYLGSALALGVIFLHCALRLYRDESHALATFNYSIVYILLLFAAMLADHWL
ncbi:MAG: protoheme IX farnesyltransferase [Gammaproteobacteria bacterium AqS3]|nr:protoheme IX farnesyltransferase [Gammaproteobacteria bacterium AqS3]